MESRIKTALVASPALGDGVIFMILANNLALNGFDVTLYSNPFSAMAEWLPRISVRPAPELAACSSEFAAYDLVFADSTSILAKPHWQAEHFPELAAKYIYIGLGRVEDALRHDHTERLREQLPPELFDRCHRLADSSGEIRFRNGDRSTTMAREAVDFCREVWGLKQTEKSTGMVPPPHLQLKLRGNTKRILIHPFSSENKRNWPLSSFVKLARRLQQDGWQPEFCSGKNERPQLLAEVGNAFPTPEFATLPDFAAYIYESFLLVGNDSGPVHLASALGVPTLSIGARGKNHRWRPDLSPGRVALPLLKIRLGRKTIWKPFLPVWRVYRDFKILANAI